MNRIKYEINIPILIENITHIVGKENVINDPIELSFLSTDVFRHADVDSILSIRPGTSEELAAVVGLCTKAGFAMVPRGGGLSYTGGFLPIDPHSVTIDMSRMNQILEINAEDMYVTVEAGCTWRKLYETLRPLGLRTPYFGPMSGYSSTVGGALSQGSIFLGSTQYGSTAETTLGLQVALADGSLVTTGSGGGLYRPNPFFRAHGPDLTGIFLNDCGVMGFKTKATLRLIQFPKYTGFLTFTFGSDADLLKAMSEVSRQGLAAECYGASPFVWGMRLWDTDLSKDIMRLRGVVKSNRTVVGGIKDAVRIATLGRRALQDVEFAMNIAVDGDSQAEIDAALARIRAISSDGREVEPTAPKAVRGSPFLPPDDLLGPTGKRWAPIHGIAPHSRAIEMATALQAFFADRAAMMERLQIEWGYVSFAISTSAILIEPMIYWPDAREAYHERMITPAHLAKLPKLPPDPEAAEAVRVLRADITQMWMELGCAHLQIGKTYRYLESRQPAFRSLLEGIKHYVDPDGRINPGTLGLF